MKGMASAQEFIQAPPPGRYPIQLDAVEAGFSSKGETHLKVSGSIIDGPHKGASFFSYIGTDGGTKYGSMGKKHLRNLGVPVDSDSEIPDAVIAGKLTGLRLFAECGNEQRQKPIVEGSKDMAPQFELVLDKTTGQQTKVAIMNLTIIGYISQAGFKLDFGQGQQQTQGQPVYQAPPGQIAQGGYTPAPGFAPPTGQPVYGAPPQGYAPQVAAPQGQPQFAPPPGFAPPQAGYVAAVAPTPWNGAPQGGAPGAPR